MQFEQDVYGEADMVSFGRQISIALKEGGVVYLQGDLGMGKTTLVRGILNGFDYSGPVKSPTYTLVEPYELDELEAFHFDLYRVGDPEELEYMGIRDYFTDNSLCFIEWPEMGRGVLPEADCVIQIERIAQGRNILVKGQTDKGKKALKLIKGTIE